MTPKQQRAAEIFLELHGLVMKVAFRAAPMPDHVDDIVQDTFNEFVSNAERFDLDDAPKALLCSITRTIALRYWQQRQKERSEVLRKIGERFRSLGEENQLAEEENEKGVYKNEILALELCLDRLAPRSRNVVNLFYFQKCSLSEIEKQVRLSPNALSQLLFRIRRKLKQCLEKILSNHPVSE